MEHLPPENGTANVNRKISWAAALGGLIALLALLAIARAAWQHDRDTDMALMISLMMGFALVLLGMILLYVRLRNAHHRAEQTQSTFETAIQSLSDGFAITDADGTVVLTNRRMHEMMSHDDTCLATLDANDREMEIQLADGRWVLRRSSGLPGGGMAIACTDITALKRREQAFMDHATRYRDMVERSPVPIYVHRDRIVLYANTATAKILGYETPDDIVGKNIFDLIHTEHHKLALRRLEQVTEMSDPLPKVDMTFVREDGSNVHTESQVSTVVFDGEPALESILYDVSARRVAERAMRESEQRYRNLFELSPDAIIVHDGESVLFANDSAAQMLGAQRDIDLFGMDIDRFNIDADATSPLSLTTAPGNAAPNTPQACQLRRLDGETFHAEIVVAKTPHRGQIVEQAVIRDVTQRKRMDAAIAQNAKLASLGGMAAGLAHELSQPLNIMRFAAEGGLLKMANKAIDDTGHTKKYTLIQDQAERMAQVMDNMRIFSRKDTKPMGAFDLALAARNICHLVRNPFRVDDVHILIEGPIAGIHANGSAVQFEQVMLNLLNNARDSILEHRQWLDLDEPGRITIELAAENGEITISVTDNGGGISEANLDNIFDPFFTTKDAGKGTGLGLAISHEIITTMSGTMGVRNTGQGARFTVHLPLSEDVPRASHAPSDQPNRPAPRPADVGPAPTGMELAQLPGVSTAPRLGHVLVVEDEIEAAHAMAEFLRDEGFKVSTAHNGREGLESYRALCPDVVITDIRMPGMNGADLITALRREREDLPIIAVTGHMGETECIEHDGGTIPVKVLKKPVSLVALSREIDLLGAA